MKRETVWWVFLVIFIVLLLSSVVLICKSSKMNEYTEENIYFFYFALMTQDFNSTSNNKIHLQNFCFYYDFTKNKANISFDLDSKNWSLSYIDIDFPSIIQNDTLKIYSMKDGIETDIGANKIEITDLNHLKISDFNRKFNNEKIIIEFNSDLLPQGGFSFFNNVYDNLNANDKQGNINFVLGDDFECIGDCIYDLKYIEKTQYSSDRNIKLKFIDNEVYNNKWFKLNTANREIRWKKTLFFGIGISGIVASLNSILILLYEDWYNNGFKNIKYVHQYINNPTRKYLNFFKKTKQNMVLLKNNLRLKIQKKEGMKETADKLKEE